MQLGRWEDHGGYENTGLEISSIEDADEEAYVA
jgi:hypothetical protein